MNKKKQSLNQPFFKSLTISKYERELLKIFLIRKLQELFCELFKNKIQQNQIFFTEYHSMDNKIIQLLIQDIIETEEYTMEGIANQTHVPFDIIYDAACGIRTQLSLTSIFKIMDLYTQIKPEIKEILCEKLLQLHDKNPKAISWLLNEP